MPCMVALGIAPVRDSGGYFYNLRGEVEVVAGTVKPLGRRDRKLSNVTPLIGYFLHRYFRHTKVSPTPKYRGFDNE